MTGASHFFADPPAPLVDPPLKPPVVLAPPGYNNAALVGSAAVAPGLEPNPDGCPGCGQRTFHWAGCDGTARGRERR